MSENKDITFAGHNYKADYKFKITTGQKADGAIQTKEVKTQGDEYEPLIALNLDMHRDTYAMGKERGYNMVSPYVKGREPV